jgi:hypothetical protein
MTLALTDDVARPKPPPPVNQPANPIKSSLLKPNQTESNQIKVKSHDLAPPTHTDVLSKRVTGHFKTSQSGSNQNQPLRGGQFISALLSQTRRISSFFFT